MVIFLNEIAEIIVDIVSSVGIPFACFAAMFYLCDKTLTAVKDSINELKEVVSAQNELIREVTQNAISTTVNS